MKKLPLAITSFEKIRNPAQNYLYVDKTAHALRLVEKGEYYFLSRPRRFGKSLFLDTLSNLFQAKQPLFKGLTAEKQWDWSVSYPVIRIDFNTGDFSTEQGLHQSIVNILQDNQRRLNITCENSDDIPGCFTRVIQTTCEKYQQKVVILIDEYDKPMLDNITQTEQAKLARNKLKSFYSVIKSMDACIRFVFITGVSKFSKMNLFSGLNNLTDITTMSDYADICGYTHHDLQTTFAEHLQSVDMDKLRQWYNGYNYLGGEDRQVYNPYDILLFIENHGEYKNYWWETGNPSFLIDTLKEQNYYIPDLENIIVNEEILNTFDIEKIDLVALLWQTGYLTFACKIIKRNKIRYQLKVPNQEIQASLNELFVQYLTSHRVEAIRIQDNLYDALEGSMDDLKNILHSLFASIPYNNYANKIIERYEGYYASVVFTYLMSLGFPCVAEDVTNKGRIDLTIKLPERIIIIEFKVDHQEPALAQIQEKKYYEKYQSEARQNQQELYIVGINFDSRQKNISDFQWQAII